MYIFTLVISLDFSCVNTNATTLDANSTVWNLETWGRPYRLVSPLLDCSSPETTPIQAESGWPFPAVLMRSGDVYRCPPPLGQYEKVMAELDEDESTRAIVPDGETVIPCHTWEMNMDLVKLPIPPDLPDLPMTGLSEEERRKETKFIEISAFWDGFVGLTNKGHVLKVNQFAGQDSFDIWHYVSGSARMIGYPFLNRDTQLPNFSEIDEVKKNPAFHTTTGNDGRGKPPQVELSSDTMLITHVSYIAPMDSQRRVCLRSFNVQVSAQGGSFFAYSSSMVLEGAYNTTPEMLPTIVPELQNRSIISVFRSPSHSGALTSSGKLLTWGHYYGGALGLGDPGKLPVGSPGGYGREGRRKKYGYLQPLRVTVPTEVRFDHGLAAKGRVERYCFAAAVGGGSTAALIIDHVGDETPPEDLEQRFETALSTTQW